MSAHEKMHGGESCVASSLTQGGHQLTRNPVGGRDPLLFAVTPPMVDIFISYSKKDRPLTESLAKKLELKGYSIWWDTALVSGDSFRKVILAELASARAAIVIWTAASVESEWVYSEASRAHDRGILIPVRTEGLNFRDIPLPFDGLHTELVTNLPAIEVALLAKLGPPKQKATQLSVTDTTTSAPAEFWLRRHMLAAIAVVVIVLVGATAATFYLTRPPPVPASRELSATAAVVWQELPPGTRFASKVSVASYAKPDRQSERSINIEPGRTIPTAGATRVLARGTVRGEPWLRFPLGSSEFGYVPENDDVELLPPG